MADADVRGMLKVNARKVAEEPRAFFFVADKETEILYIDKKFDDPSRFGNLKKVTKVVATLFSEDISGSAKMCAGTVTREEGTLIFSPTLQKSNATSLKRGIKGYKKELGPCEVRVAADTDTDEDTPETASSTAPTTATFRGLDRVATAIATFQAASGTDVAGAATAALRIIDRYLTVNAEQEGAESQEVAGKTVSAWQEELASQEDGGSDAELTETIQEVLRAQTEARAELATQRELLSKTRERLDEGNVRLVEGIIDITAVQMIQGKDLGSLASIVGKLSSTVEKLKGISEDQRKQTDTVLQSMLQVDMLEARKDVLEKGDEHSKAKKALEETSSVLVDEVVSRSLVAIGQGKELGSLAALIGKSGDLLDKLKDDLQQEQEARLSLEEARLREQHLERQQELIVKETRVRETTRVVKELEDEVVETTIETVSVGLVQGGLSPDLLKSSLSDLSTRLDAAVREQEQAVSELTATSEDCQRLSLLRTVAEAFRSLRTRADKVSQTLGTELSDDERNTAEQELLEVRLSVRDQLEQLSALRASAPPTAVV